VIGVLSRGIARIPHLEQYLGEPWTRVGGLWARDAAVDKVAGWGLKPTASRARAWAAARGLPYLALEDGFLRSVGLGQQDPPCSLVIDDLGIYYDAAAPSRLEALVHAAHTPAQVTRARELMAQWRAGRLSKYNHAREMRAGHAGFVLAVDQTFGDASIGHGLADAASFKRMLTAALDENPGMQVVLKVHPDVVCGRRRGHFNQLTDAQRKRVTLLAADAHPAALLASAHVVYTVTSQMGFEALLWGRRVRTFGMPFYAGWGLTQDELPPPSRRSPVALESLVHAALVDYPRYVDPETGQRCDVERVMDWLALQRRLRERFPAHVQALSFSRWKKPIVRSFFAGSAVSFVRKRATPDTPLAVWGRRPVDAAHSTNIIRLEDGFLRSVGLGADLVRPLSWVMDGSGIYYDATAPSDLERLLGTHAFEPALLERARHLRERVCALGLTKYNVGHGGWAPPKGRHLVLVVGQVEGDASLAFGAPGARTNIELLRTVRRERPDAYVVYKPHPDVVARLRAAGSGEREAPLHCDEVVADVAMHALLEAVDEVHVLTSLAGFEALLRGRKVVAHGCPFFAGWGLTEDRHPMPRRVRRLALDELVAGALVLYPVYVSRVTGRFTTPERAIDELLAWRQQTPARPRPAWWRRVLRTAAALRSLRDDDGRLQTCK
jgi:capsular polysaccharide export protein